MNLPDGYRLLEFAALPSTNDYLKENVGELSSKTIAWAHLQTAGRGRKTRDWFADHSSLTFSVLYKFENGLDLRSPQWLNLWPALAVYQALAELGIDAVSLKWPNDVLVNSKKVAGILCEIRRDSRIRQITVGIGVNIDQPSHVFTGGLATAGSLFSLTGEHIDQKQLLQIAVNQLDAFFKNLIISENYPAIRKHWLAACGHLGEPVKIIHNASTLTGTFIGLTDSGLPEIESDGILKIVDDYESFSLRQLYDFDH